MDPVSITVACVGLLSGLTTISTKIRNLTIDASNTAKEVTALQTELDSLQRSLALFYGGGLADRYPEHLRTDLEKIIRECKFVVDEIDRLLDRMTPNGFPQRLQWSLSTRDEVLRLHRSLEGHKSAISIAIAFASMSMNCGIKSDTSSIRSKAAKIPEIQSQLAAVLDAIQSLCEEEPSQKAELGLSMQRFLHEAYVESIAGGLLRSRASTLPSIADPFEDTKSTSEITGRELSELQPDRAIFSSSASIRSESTVLTPLTEQLSLHSDSPLNEPSAPLHLIRNFHSAPDQLLDTNQPASLNTTLSKEVEAEMTKRNAATLRSLIALRVDADNSARKNPRWKEQLKGRPARFHSSSKRSSFKVTRKTVMDIGGLLAAEPVKLKNSLAYNKEKFLSQHLHERSVAFTLSATSSTNRDIDIAFQEAVKLHQSGYGEKATSVVKELADKGHIPSQIMYGLALRCAWGTHKDDQPTWTYHHDDQSARTYLYSAARSIIELELRSHADGPFLTDDLALEMLKTALYEIAECYRYPWGWDELGSSADAHRFLSVAAELEDQAAICDLADCYLVGYGCNKNKYVAARLLRTTIRESKSRDYAWIWKSKYSSNKD